ncbi:MAG: antibiotic biosynthesis monooxygenase [Chlamydiales bacterium]
MPQPNGEKTILINKILIRLDQEAAFIDWQAELNSTLSAFPGFISLEVLSPIASVRADWMIIQQFKDPEQLTAWLNSEKRKSLLDSLHPLLMTEVQEAHSAIAELHGGVVEVFMTEVDPEKVHLYRNWVAKIHRIEAKFQGFQSVYVQHSAESHSRNWITLLRFDTPDNLDRWLTSKERLEVLREAESMVVSIKRHRVISPYAGWFSSFAKAGDLPSVWKQSMIVLLILFPIVMLESKFLLPYIHALNPSVRTFIANTISIALIAWPMTPIAIWFLDWWLSAQPRHWKNSIGTCVVIALYLLEIILFWYFT